MNNISTLPPKGTSDWEPQEYKLRSYIFETWRRVCENFGYQEYLTPLVEHADVYRAKSGEDVGGSELTVFEDRGGRELAIRPEMTPSVTRMVAERYQALPKPIRLFSIANFFRNQKPQRGRNREFWQLNFDLFGADELRADAEILQMAIEIMLEFGATSEHFTVYVNHRGSIENFVTSYLQIPEENLVDATRLLDKLDKISEEELVSGLEELGAEITDEKFLLSYLKMDQDAVRKMREQFMQDDPGQHQLVKLRGLLESAGLANYIEYNPGLMRGFDYYDGMVFEVFDKHPDNNRSLYGGGRYNGLAGIFGKDDFPAVGCAPGDEPTKLFLKSNELLPDKLHFREGYYLPIIDENIDPAAYDKLAADLRNEDRKVIRGLAPERIGNALSTADSMQAKYAILLGSQELEKGVYQVKDLETGEQEEIRLSVEI